MDTFALINGTDARETVLYFVPDVGPDTYPAFVAALELAGARPLRGASCRAGAWHVRAIIGETVRNMETDGSDGAGRRQKRLDMRAAPVAFRYVETFDAFLSRIDPARADELDPSGSFH